MSQPHPASPRAMRDTLALSAPESMSAGMSLFQVSTDARYRFTLPISENILVKGFFEGKLFSRHEGENEYRDIEIRSAILHADLVVLEDEAGNRTDDPETGHNIYEYDAATLYIPEWMREIHETPPSPEELTRILALGGDRPDLAFPGWAPGQSDSEAEIEEQVRRENAHRKDNAHKERAANWITEEIEGGQVWFDPESLRVAIDGAIYDGTGKLLAFPLLLRREALEGILETHGEDRVHELLTSGHIHAGGAASSRAQTFSPAQAQKICDRISGRVSPGFLPGLRAPWDPDLFEALIRPHVDPRPFARPPLTIDGVDTSRVFMEAHIAALEGSAPAAP